MRLFSIETNTVKLDGGSLFGNTPKTLWEKWLVSDERNRIELACRALLMQTDQGQNILFEAGSGPFFDPKLKDRYGIENDHRLLKNLSQLGLNPIDIHAVVLSHLHFDHAGGLLSSYDDGELKLIFPKAKFFISREHWHYANQPHMRERASFIPELHRLLEQSGRLIFVEGSKHEDLPFAHFHFSNGHTIGMMLSELNLHSGPLVYCADLIPGKAWMHLPITMGYDRYAELIVNEKIELLKQISERNGFVFFSHDPLTECLKISQNSTGKYEGNVVQVETLS